MSKHGKFSKAAVVAFGVLLLGLGWGGYVVAKTPTAPPTIDAIVGNWTATASLVIYDLDTGAQHKVTGQGTYAISKVDDTTVNMVYTGNNGGFGGSGAIYVDGTLLIGAGDDDTLPTSVYSAYAQIKGSAGKLSGKGQVLEYDTGDGFLEIGTVTLKQLQPQ